MNGKKTILFFMVGLLLITIILPTTTAMRKPDFALDEEDVEGWWIDREDGMEISGTGMKMTMWYQTWINNETWATADAAFYLMIVDMGGMIDFDLIWDEYVLGLAGYSPEACNISGFAQATIYNISDIWYGLGYNGSKLVWIIGTDEQGIPALPDLSVELKSPTNGTGTEEDVEDLMTAQGVIIGLGTGIPGFEVLTVITALTIVIGVIILLRKENLRFIPTI